MLNGMRIKKTKSQSVFHFESVSSCNLFYLSYYRLQNETKQGIGTRLKKIIIQLCLKVHKSGVFFYATGNNNLAFVKQDEDRRFFEIQFKKKRA
jgi:hypothetical protein